MKTYLHRRSVYNTADILKNRKMYSNFGCVLYVYTLECVKHQNVQHLQELFASKAFYYFHEFYFVALVKKGMSYINT